MSDQRSYRQLLSSTEFLAAVGCSDLSFRQLDYWARAGAITPTIEGRGSGTHRGWDPANIPHARRVARFLAFNMSTAGSDGRGGRIASDFVRVLWHTDPAAPYTWTCNGVQLSFPPEETP